MQDPAGNALAKECRTIGDIQEKLKKLFKDTIQQVLEAEMEHHLGYPKNSPEGINTGNSRKGYSQKTIKTRAGKTEIKIPRDRNGEFKPQIIRKYRTTANELEDQIIAMYAKGMSTRDIEDQMKDIYGIEVSPVLVSKVTDKILPQIVEWQS
ncbi:IS256 family transposase ISDku1 [Moorella thermoacetica]